MADEQSAITERSQRALQVAYDVFREQGEWPSFQYVDQRLDRDGHDAMAAVLEIPAALAFFDKRNPRLDSVVLTLAGVAQASGSQADCALFLRLLRWCVARESEFTLDSPTAARQELAVTSEEFDAESEGPVLGEADQRKALSYLRTENLTMGSGGPGAPPEVWSATLNQEHIRKLRHAESIEDYLAIRSAERTTPAQSTGPPAIHRPVPLVPFGSAQLQRGQRLKIVKDAAAALAAMGDVDRQLTLAGFAIEGEPGTDDGSYGYTARLLSDSDDITLIELRAHLRESPAPQDEHDGGPWEDEHFRLFLSHTHPHAAKLSDLKRELAPLGIDAFVAHADIQPTEPWQSVIEAALRTCDALAAYLTEDFPASDWTDHEVGWVTGRGRLIIPIQEALAPYGLIGKWQSVRSSRPDLADGVLGLLSINELTAIQMAEVQVARFEASTSPEAAGQRLALLERIAVTAWSSDLLSRVERAVSENKVLLAAELRSRPLPQLAAELVSRLRAKAGAPSAR
jgi:hypothetical protein